MIPGLTKKKVSCLVAQELASELPNLDFSAIVEDSSIFLCFVRWILLGILDLYCEGGMVSIYSLLCDS